MNEATDLNRFLDAQSPVYATVLAELRAGMKRSHWMWFVFPQMAGLGRSDMACRYAIASSAEAAAYLAHPVLGARLRECSGTVAALDARTAHEIFGSPDDMKFRSSMTLFAHVSPGGVFDECLRKYFQGKPDPATLALL
jgi:uncharacterized protein (DUF1810 family)